jgi:hypothetical protein
MVKGKTEDDLRDYFPELKPFFTMFFSKERGFAPLSLGPKPTKSDNDMFPTHAFRYWKKYYQVLAKSIQNIRIILGHYSAFATNPKLLFAKT